MSQASDHLIAGRSQSAQSPARRTYSRLLGVSGEPPNPVLMSSHGGGSGLVFLVLGPVEVRDGGRSLSLGGPKQRALLADLILNAPTVISTAQLIDDLWGDTAPASADHTVETYIARLRRVLRDGTRSEVLLTRAPGYLCLRPMVPSPPVGATAQASGRLIGKRSQFACNAGRRRDWRPLMPLAGCMARC